jgi:hypothetical protein
MPNPDHDICPQCGYPHIASGQSKCPNCGWTKGTDVTPPVGSPIPDRLRGIADDPGVSIEQREAARDQLRRT